MSFFRLVEARAHAKAGDGVAAAAALKSAEGWLERSREGDADPTWLGFYSYDRFCADAAECYRDLRMPREVRRFTEQALSRPTEEFVRSHGLRLVVSAVAELESGTWTRPARRARARWRWRDGSPRRDDRVRAGPAAPAGTVRGRAARHGAAGAGPPAARHSGVRPRPGARRRSEVTRVPRRGRLAALSVGQCTIGGGRWRWCLTVTCW
ncbi:hypothetical protein STANM309S_00724 [Streptomyces tanashiensis]